MSASSSAAVAAGGVVVVTQVIPTPQGATTPKCPEKHGFMVQLAALGMVQVLVGLMDFLFGIVIFKRDYEYTLVVCSGVYIWGALSFIVAGSLTVAAGRTLKRHLVNGALGFSVVAAVAAGVSTIIYTLDALEASFNMLPYSPYSDPYFDPYSPNSSYSDLYFDPYPPYSDHYWFVGPYTQRLSGVLAGFSVLEFAVSISVAVIGCRASLRPTDQLIIITNQSHEVASQTTETPHTYEAPPTAPPPPDSSYERMNPSEYNTAIV